MSTHNIKLPPLVGTLADLPDRHREAIEAYGQACARVAVEQAEAYADARVREAQQWQPIETAPKDGTEIIVYHPEGGVCAAFCPKEGFSWHCMDGMNTVIGKKSRQSIPTFTSFINPPTHWMPLPAPPSTPA